MTLSSPSPEIRSKAFIPAKHVGACLLLLGLFSCGASTSTFELSPAQSMSITGKGPGQDAAINPYTGQNSVAVVKNLGHNAFSIRVQDKAGNYREFPIRPGEKLEVALPAGEELYLDSDLSTRARVSFRKAKV